MDLFKCYPGIVKVILYGSRAMGNYRAGSDIDITLVTDDCFSDTDLLKLEGDLDESNLPYLMDVSILGKLQNENLIDHIKRQGKILYERGSTCVA
jgi:predicted nucleotidyltransferase